MAQNVDVKRKNKVAKYQARRARGQYLKQAQMHKIARQEIKKAERRTETKSFDGAFDYTGIDWTGTSAVWDMLSGIVQDTSDTGVLGSKIRPVGIRVNFNWKYGDEMNLCRLLLVQWKGSTATPSVAGMFQSVTNGRAPLSMHDRNYNDNYTILYDKIFDIGAQDNVQNPATIVIGAKRLRQINLTFSGGPSTAKSAIESNGLYLFAVSDSSSTAHPTLAARWRIYFKDA